MRVSQETEKGRGIGASPEAESEAETDRENTAPEASDKPREVGGPKGPEPTRFGDWERAGRCIDF